MLLVSAMMSAPVAKGRERVIAGDGNEKDFRANVKAGPLHSGTTQRSLPIHRK